MISADFKEQTKADIAHHNKRIAAWSKSSDPFLIELVKQSRLILENPCLGYRSCHCEPPCHIDP